MFDKQQILDAIGAIARRLGRAPTHAEFFSCAGISRYSVTKFFPKWNDAIRAAGLKPRKLRLWLQDSELLRDWGETVRRKRGLPSRRGYLLEGKYDPRTMEKRFGGWSSVPRAFRDFAEGKREWADVLALLAVHKRKGKAAANENSHCSIARNKGQHAQLQDRPTYGNPIDFRGLRHEPVNELGVVLRFGMVAKELGYLVEAVERGESRNFRDHGHPASGCDLIVCWRHNWDECPEDIEVVELSSVIKSLANAED